MRRFIGLLMINSENDVLERTLAVNGEFVDAFYVLDGTVPNDESRRICVEHPKCWGYTTDASLPSEIYGGKPVDGWRQALLERAYRDHGYDNWFLLLHGDEVWTKHPRWTVADRFDGYVYQLPFFFPRAGEEWEPDEHPLDQLHWHLAPGYPEFRLFLGGPDVAYEPRQHFNTRPLGLDRVVSCPDPILHYLYRAPSSQRERAAIHERTGFDPDNYRHISDRDEVLWTDEMIAERQQSPWFHDLVSNAQVAA